MRADRRERHTDGVRAVFLTGSVARGEADEFSDLDVGVLVSVERFTAAHRARAFGDPETALLNLTSLRTGVALHDPGGVFADLQGRARVARWADLAGAADAP